MNTHFKSKLYTCNFFFEMIHPFMLPYKYYVNKQSIQLSIKHLMPHVSTIKSSSSVKMII